MKLKLDLHPIYNDSAAIERSLGEIIDEAVAKRADEVEIIPGKGSGALKKTVLRFLDRPDIKAKYHRIEKDSDNFGRLFVHFRHAPGGTQSAKAVPALQAQVPCFCCEVLLSVAVDADVFEGVPVWRETVECPSCGSPNRVSARRSRQGALTARAESGYE
jgi:hypothetical protein